MTVHIIEIDDRSLRVSSPAGQLGESPGFASIAGGRPVFGESAFRQLRLHPQESFNQFWDSLSLDPMIHKNPHFRHQADVAYAHLNDISQTFGLEDDVIFAVPSHYNKPQLATLLGLSRHFPFTVVGLVDRPLLAMTDAKFEREALFMDLQLHQAVLTTFSIKDGFLERGDVLTVRGSGWLALYDAWSNLIADAFIKQSRFNPHHNADTEQFIVDQLEQWLKDISRNRELSIEINNQGTIYQASLVLSSFEQRAHNILTRIHQEISHVASPDTPIYLPAPLASLPGLRNVFTDVRGLHQDAVAPAGLKRLDLLRSSDETLKLRTRLPVAEAAAATVAAQEVPSHLLYRHEAYPLPPDGLILNGSGSTPKISGLKLDELELSSPLTIRYQAGDYVLGEHPNLELTVNGKPLTAARPLRVGDRLTLSGSNSTIEFIRVH